MTDVKRRILLDPVPEQPAQTAELPDNLTDKLRELQAEFGDSAVRKALSVPLLHVYPDYLAYSTSAYYIVST